MTGGAQGLGLVSARALLEHGISHLAIFDVDEKQGQAALEHYRDASRNEESKPVIVFKKVDVTDEAMVNEAVQDVSHNFGSIDILLCFAGITDSKLAVDYPIEQWRRIFDVNVHGSFLVARAVARSVEPIGWIMPLLPVSQRNTCHEPISDRFCRDIIARSSSGSIVFTASMSGYIVNTPQPHSAYAVSKAGVHHLTRSMAAEWVGHNIRVNSISPGIMNTRLSGGPAQAGLRRLWMERSPMGMGDPEDLTGAVILLCSDAGKFMTGVDIRIEGK